MKRRFTLVLALLLWPALVQAQPLADKVPANALLYVGWAGSDHLGAGYEGSHLKALVDESNAKEVISVFLPKMLEAIGRQQRDAAEPMQLLGVVGPALWKHPSALYVGPVDMSNPRQPGFAVALMCDAGEDAKNLTDALNLAISNAPPGMIAVANRNGLVCLEFGKAGLDAVTADNALSKAKPFTDTFSTLGKEPVFAYFANIEAVVANATAGFQAAPPDVQGNWAKVRDGLGLDSIKQVGITAGFDGKDWMSHAFISAPGPRTGVIGALLDVKPLSPEILKSIPQGATTALAGHLDLAKVFGAIRAVVAQADPNAGNEMERDLAKVAQAIGVNDIQQDVLATLGPEWALFLAPEVSGDNLAGITLVNHLADAAKFEKSVTGIEDFANEQMKQQMRGNGPQFAIKQVAADGMNVHYLATPFVTPAWGVKNGTWYAGLYPQTVTSAANYDGKSIMDNAAFTALMKRLDVKDPTSITFIDLPKTAPGSYGIVLLLTRGWMGFGDLFGVTSPPLTVPTLQKLMPHLTPAGAASWIDEKGWHSRQVLPFPGAEFLGNTVMTIAPMAVSVVPSILMPAMSQARQRAARVKSASNLGQIGKGCFLYANDHKGSFPDSLGLLTKEEDLAPQTFVHPQNNTPAPHDLKPDAAAEWVDEHSDYVYVGKGLTSNSGAGTIVAYEHPEQNGMQGANVLYADGHVDWLPLGAFMDAVKPKPQ